MPRRVGPTRAERIVVAAAAALLAAAGDADAQAFAAEQRGLDEALRPSPQKNGQAPSARYAYLVSTQVVMNRRVVQFTAWFDADRCAVPVAGHEPIAPAAYAVRGRLERSEEGVRIDAHASALSGATVGRTAVEIRGVDAAAVTRATRQVLQRLELVCRP
jgi:hypothetical protein